MYTLRTGSDWNDLTVVELERAEKELPVSEVAKGGYPLSFGFPFAPSATRDFLTGKNLGRACLLYLVTLNFQQQQQKRGIKTIRRKIRQSKTPHSIKCHLVTQY